MVMYQLNQNLTLIVIIFQKKPSRIDVIDENVEEIKVIDSTPQGKKKTQVNC